MSLMLHDGDDFFSSLLAPRRRRLRTLLGAGSAWLGQASRRFRPSPRDPNIISPFMSGGASHLDLYNPQQAMAGLLA